MGQKTQQEKYHFQLQPHTKCAPQIFLGILKFIQLYLSLFLFIYFLEITLKITSRLYFCLHNEAPSEYTSAFFLLVKNKIIFIYLSSLSYLYPKNIQIKNQSQFLCQSQFLVHIYLHLKVAVKWDCDRNIKVQWSKYGTIVTFRHVRLDSKFIHFWHHLYLFIMWIMIIFAVDYVYCWRKFWSYLLSFLSM